LVYQTVDARSTLIV